MDRRSFLRTGAAGSFAGAAAATSLAMPAVAQPRATVLWRCVSAFPLSARTMHAGALDLARLLREASDGAFSIEVVPSNPDASGSVALEAVMRGDAEMCHAPASAGMGRSPVYALAGGIPFGLNARGLDAWMTKGGGAALVGEVFARDGLHFIPGGSTGTPMGGWFLREIEKAGDLRGLRMRIAGLGGRVLEKLGGVPVELDDGDVAAALRDGRLDGTTWAGPYEEGAFAIAEAAPYHAYPGWWEGGAQLAFFLSRARFEALPPAYRSLLATAARAAAADMRAASDIANPPALKRLVAAGAQLRPFSQVLLNACFDASASVSAEISAQNADFARVHASITAFRNESFLHAQISDYTYDTFLMIKQREGALAALGR